MSEAMVAMRMAGRHAAWPGILDPWQALLHRAMSWAGAFAGRMSGWRRDAAGAEGRPSFELAALPHLDGAYNLARYLCRDGDAAQDIVQDAYLRAYRSWADFRGGSVRAWLFAIVRNCHYSWRDERRRQATASALPAGNDDEGPDDALASIAAEGDPETALLRTDEAACVRRTLRGLPQDMREILVLRDLEDCSYREIADILELPMGTVMSRLSRARRAFAETWERDMEGTSRG